MCENEDLFEKKWADSYSTVFGIGISDSSNLTLYADGKPYMEIGEDTYDPYEDIVSELKDTYERKNADYGNSFDKSIDEFGYISAVVRMSDKMERMKSLIKDEGRVEDESLEDTVMDMANYAIMFAMYIRKGETDDR